MLAVGGLESWQSKEYSALIKQYDQQLIKQYDQQLIELNNRLPLAG